MRWTVPLTLAAVTFAAPAWATSKSREALRKKKKCDTTQVIVVRDKKVTVVNLRLEGNSPTRSAQPDAWPKEWQWKWPGDSSSPHGKSLDELRKDIQKQMEEMRKDLKPHDEPSK